MSKFCFKCGAELKATSKFCPTCGKPVVDRQAETVVQTVKHYTEVTKAKEQINRGIKTIAQAVERTMFSAPVTPGEFALGSVRMLPSPDTVISGGFNNVLLSFRTSLKHQNHLSPLWQSRRSKVWFLKMLEGWLMSAMEMGGKTIGKLIGDICGFILMQFLKMSMTESVQRAGREAFDSALREGIKYSGGHITRELINTAQWAKAAAKAERIEFLMDTAIESSKNSSDATAKFVGDCLKSGKVDHLFALLLNYSVGGKESDNEALGGNTADVIFGFFQDRFGLKVSQVLNTLANPMDISIRTGL